MSPHQLGHVHLKVRDLEPAVAFYVRLLGLTVSERVGDHYVFLTGDGRHHALALQAVGPAAPAAAAAAAPGAVGLYHIAFEVPDRGSLAEAVRTARALGVTPALVDHGISWAAYLTDPSGNGLEIYWDTRDERHGRASWEGRARPLSLGHLDDVSREEAA